MENASKIHNEFLEDLTQLVDKFHKEHPSLFINDIDVVSGENTTGYKQLLGIRVEIRVQPDNK